MGKVEAYSSSVTYDAPKGYTWGRLRDGDAQATLSSWMEPLTYRERPLEERNGKYVLLGQALVHLGNMGASDEQLRRLARRGGNVTMRDIAEVYCANLRPGDNDDYPGKGD